MFESFGRRFDRLVRGTPTRASSGRRYVIAVAALLGFALLWRAVVAVPQRPQSNDNHLGVIDYIANHHALPPSGAADDAYQPPRPLDQTYHPPLYYVLALPFYALGHRKGTEAFSLLLSLANVLLVFAVVWRSSLVRDSAAKLAALAVAAVLPNLILYGNYIGNDALSFLVGTALAAAALGYARRPTRRRLVGLSVVAGLGLLTKGTFVALVPAVVPVIVIALRSRRVDWARCAAAVIVFLGVAALVGGYKFAENLVHFGRPLVHNMELGYAWVDTQRPTVTSWRSLVDFDLPALVADPRVKGPARYSVPLLMYGSAWAQIETAPGLPLAHPLPRRVASALLVLGLVPTALILLGTARLARAWLRDGTPGRRAMVTTILLMPLANLAVVLAAGLRFDAWSCFNSRLLLPTLAAWLVLLAAGAEVAFRRRGARPAVLVCTAIWAALSVVYLLVGVAGKLQGLPWSDGR